MSQSKIPWTPPDGYDLGEGTWQAREARDDPTEFDADEWWTDAYEMRMIFGIEEFDPDTFNHDPYPDCLIHEDPAEETTNAGGTDWLRVGERGCGKSNDSLFWALRLMEVNDERVVWRGSPQRSEWLPFKDWTVLWLPEHADVDAEWLGRAQGSAEAHLEDEVREVVRYTDPIDLLERLEDRPGGTFNVVYPDPSFTGCFDLSRETDRVTEPLPFLPKWQTLGDQAGTPLPHWWYAFLLAAVEYRRTLSWLSVIFDEAGDLTPEGAEDDEHKTYAKLKMLRSIYADSRRQHLSLYWSAHYEENLHHKIRREVEWRIDMADGTPNPRTKKSSSIPVGFGTVKMETDFMSKQPWPGKALLYNQNEFCFYAWKHIDRDDIDGWLKLDLTEPEAPEGEEEQAGPVVRYDDSVFKRWRKPGEDRLYVRDPGDGYVDLKAGTEAEPLAWPKPGWRFGGLEDRGDTIAIELRPDRGGDDAPDDPDEAVLVAEFPMPEVGGIESNESDDEFDDRGEIA